MDRAETQFNLGLTLRDAGRLDESVQTFKSAAHGYSSMEEAVRGVEAKSEAEMSRRIKVSQPEK